MNKNSIFTIFLIKPINLLIAIFLVSLRKISINNIKFSMLPRIFLGGFALSLSSGLAAQGWNFKTFQTAIGEEILSLHNFLMIFIIIIFVGVFYFMFHALIMHRKSKIADGHKPSNFHENIWVEVIWTLIPFIILIIMAIPTTISILKVRDNNDSDYSILVTGYQYKWGYEYLDGPAKGLKYISNLITPQEEINNKIAKGEDYLLEVDNPLVIPQGKKTKFLITSNDVLHAFFVPELAMQQTAVPGFIREFSVNPLNAGTIRGQCSELCGSGHAFMPIVIEVLPEDEYHSWAEQKLAKASEAASGKDLSREELMELGKKVYETNCVTCHKANGEGLAPVFPSIANSQLVQGDKKAVIDIIANGRDGTAMSPFAQLIGDQDVAAVVTYIRNSFDNNTDDLVQPSEVADIKK